MTVIFRRIRACRSIGLEYAVLQFGYGYYAADKQGYNYHQQQDEQQTAETVSAYLFLFLSHSRHFLL